MVSASRARWYGLISFAVFMASMGTLADAQGPKIDTLTGDRRTACEVVLCLSSGNRPHECTGPLKKFFSIKAKKPWKTIKKRKKFLQLCPSGDYEHRETHITALAEGGGRCDMASLVAELNLASPPYTKPLPTYCTTLVSHDYTTAYDLPVRLEQCYTDHLQELGPRPIPIEAYTDAAGYDVVIMNQTELDAYDTTAQLQRHHPTPICVSRWIDPSQPVPENTLTRLLDTEVTRIHDEIVWLTAYDGY